MANVVRTIPNLINGISQQAATLRLDTQADEQINAFSSIEGGLRKRPPSEYMREVPGDLDAFFHIIDRPGNSSIASIYDNSGTKAISVRPLDSGSVAPAVTTPDGVGYLSCDNPSRDLRAITIADTTIILNKTKTVALTSDVTGSLPNSALLSINSGLSDVTYEVYINGTKRADYTPTTTAADYQTDNIATELYNDLVAAALPNFTFTLVGSFIHVVNSSVDFDISVEDSKTGEMLSVIKHEVGKFTDLPARAPDGYLVRITSEDGVNSTDYWVKFLAEDSSRAISTGVWEEAPGPGVKYRLDASTMPHRLIPDEGNPGDYIFEQIEWNDRTVGDGDAIPAPSMIGKQLSEVFYHESRLGFLADINILLSASGDVFNFWRSTATDILDDDTIDIQVASDSGSELVNAVAFDERLVVFSKREQFVIEGNDTLTPLNVSSKLVTKFNSSTRTRPVHTGRNIYFPFGKGAYSGVREYFVAADIDSFDAADVTAHVPRYIPGEVRHVTATTNEDIVAVLPTGEDNAIYLYKFFWSGNQKIQSSWSKMTFDGGIFYAEFIESDLYVVCGRFSDGEDASVSSLVRIRFSANADVEKHLDRRVDESQVSMVYDGVTDTTSITLPYGPDPDNTVMVIGPDSATKVEGRIISLDSIDTATKTITCTGDFTAETFYVGHNYEMLYRFSPAYVKQESSSGGQTVVSGGRVQVRRWRVVYVDSGYFVIRVSLVGRDARDYEWSGKTLGSINAIIGRPSIDSGEYSVPVAGKNTEMSVEIINNTHLPSNFTSASWDADFIQRSKL